MTWCVAWGGDAFGLGVWVSLLIVVSRSHYVGGPFVVNTSTKTMCQKVFAKEWGTKRSRNIRLHATERQQPLRHGVQTQGKFKTRELGGTRTEATTEELHRQALIKTPNNHPKNT